MCVIKVSFCAQQSRTMYIVESVDCKLEPNCQHCLLTGDVDPSSELLTGDRCEQLLLME